MGQYTNIEWASSTFNPWIGCTKVSAGCDHCYAEALDKRLWNGAHWGGTRRRLTSAAMWKEPLVWNRKQREHEAAVSTNPRPRVFCASMADVFDPVAPQAWRERLWDTIDATPALNWLLLTKRPGFIGKMLRTPSLPNVWLGTSVENQQQTQRIGLLMQTPAVQYFLSVEPMLGPIQLPDQLPPNLWVICGGESGPNARPFDPDWARDLQNQCAAVGATFFMKQMGSAPAGLCLQHKKGGDPQEWPQDLNVRILPKRSFFYA